MDRLTGCERLREKEKRESRGKGKPRRKRRTVVASNRSRQSIPRTTPLDPRRAHKHRTRCVHRSRLFHPATDLEPRSEETLAGLTALRGALVDAGRSEEVVLVFEAEGGDENVVALRRGRVSARKKGTGGGNICTSSRPSACFCGNRSRLWEGSESRRQRECCREPCDVKNVSMGGRGEKEERETNRQRNLTEFHFASSAVLPTGGSSPLFFSSCNHKCFPITVG